MSCMRVDFGGPRLTEVQLDRASFGRRKACIVAIAAAVLGVGASAHAETIATFTRNPANPILRGVRTGSEIAAQSLGAQVVHFIPRNETPAEQLGLIDEVVRNKPDAIVLAPFDPKAMVPGVDRKS